MRLYQGPFWRIYVMSAEEDVLHVLICLESESILRIIANVLSLCFVLSRLFINYQSRHIYRYKGLTQRQQL